MPTLNAHLRSRIGKVCVAITGGSAAEMIERASRTAKETPFLEFRLDYLDKPLLALPKLKQFLLDNSAVTAVATCRREETGGRFAGNVSAEIDVLAKAAAAGFHLLDVELETAEALKKGDLTKLRESGVGLILSWHDSKGTPDLDAIYARMEPFQPDIVKVVPTARTLVDNLTLMRFIERISDVTPIIGICMGEAGIISRVLGLRAGSISTFSATSAGEETAPGQMAARTLIETYRIEEIDAATKIYGVAGSPVGKSLSPVMMNAAFRRETVNAVYLALQTDKVADLVELIQKIPIHGVSVTMPHKQAILPYLEHMDPLSQKIGAVNTVLRAQDGKLYGFNTDVIGILGPLEKRMPLKGAKVLVLGAGGSARAAVFGLRDKGAEVFILNRTPETAAKLAKQSGAKIIKHEAIAKSSFDVIVNATPVGMAGQKAAPILKEDELRAKLVFDLVYNPLDTPLIRMARQQNIPVITGVEMFIQQGARQFEIWTGKPAPEEEMLRVVVHALRQQSETTSAASVATAAPAEHRSAGNGAVGAGTGKVKPAAAPSKAKSRKAS